LWIKPFQGLQCLSAFCPLGTQHLVDCFKSLIGQSPVPFGVHTIPDIIPTNHTAADILSPVPFGIHTIPDHHREIYCAGKVQVSNAFRRSHYSRQRKRLWHSLVCQRLQCLSAFTPFPTQKFFEFTKGSSSVSSAFRRSHHSRLQSDWEAMLETIKSPVPFGVHSIPDTITNLNTVKNRLCLQCLSAFTVFPTALADERYTLDEGSPVPFGVHSIPDHDAVGLAAAQLKVSSAFRRSQYSRLPDRHVERCAPAQSPVPFGVHSIPDRTIYRG